MVMTVGSLFSGVGGFDLGFVRAGFDVRWQCEIDRDARDVLYRQFPECEVIYSDVRTFNGTMLEPVDLICGGFPCQDVSVAGRRAGLDGERSGLWHEYHRVLREVRPAWCVIENVPGLLSSCGCATCGAVRRLLRVHAYLRKKRGIHQPCAVCRAGERMLASHRGRDFAIILRGLVDLGYGVSWRVLDAQYNGVPQRRRRLFLVGHLGDGRAAEVLFEPACVPGNPPPRREAGQGVAASLTSGSHPNSNRPGRHSEDDVNLVAGPLTNRYHKGVNTTLDDGALVAHALTAEEADASEDGTGRGTSLVVGSFEQNSMAGRGTLGYSAGDGVVRPVKPQSDHQMIVTSVAFAENQRGELRTSDISAQLTSGGGKPGQGYPAVAFNQNSYAQDAHADQAGSLSVGHGIGDANAVMGVRRLTPTECERLMSWPDDHTRYGASGKEMADSTRYRMCGNGVVANVSEWIARRIAQCTQGEVEEGRDGALVTLPLRDRLHMDVQPGSEGRL